MKLTVLSIFMAVTAGGLNSYAADNINCQNFTKLRAYQLASAVYKLELEASIKQDDVKIKIDEIDSRIASAPISSCRYTRLLEADKAKKLSDFNIYLGPTLEEMASYREELAGCDPSKYSSEKQLADENRVSAQTAKVEAETQRSNWLSLLSQAQQCPN